MRGGVAGMALRGVKIVEILKSEPEIDDFFKWKNC